MNIRKILSNFYRKSELGYYSVRIFYKIYILILQFIPDEIIVKNSFRKHMGYNLDLNNPKTLNEKLNWLKLYHRKTIHTLIADKFKVREYVAKKIGSKYLIPLIFDTNNAKELIPDNLPKSDFIIKTNHDSSGGLIVREVNDINWKKVQKRFRRLLKDNHYVLTREWQYKNISRKIIVEQLLTTKEGHIPNDYKFQFLNGKLAFVLVDIDRFGERRTRNLYDKDWNLLPCEWGRPNGIKIEKPKNFEEMLNVAKILAEDFICIRVDFYNLDGKIYFGELTLHHASGFQKFLQIECDHKFGNLLNIKNLQLSKK